MIIINKGGELISLSSRCGSLQKHHSMAIRTISENSQPVNSTLATHQFGGEESFFNDDSGDDQFLEERADGIEPMPRLKDTKIWRNARNLFWMFRKRSISFDESTTAELTALRPMFNRQNGQGLHQQSLGKQHPLQSEPHLFSHQQQYNAKGHLNGKSKRITGALNGRGERESLQSLRQQRSFDTGPSFDRNYGMHKRPFAQQNSRSRSP